MLNALRGVAVLNGSAELFGQTQTLNQRLSAAVERKPGLEPTAFKISDAVDVSKIEKHLDDVNKGRGHLSGKTGKDLAALNYKNSSQMARIDPGASQLYAGIVSGLNYQLNARLVNNLSQSAETSSKLRDLASIDQEKATDDLVQELTGKSVAELKAEPVAAAKVQAVAAYASAASNSIE